MSSAPLPDVTKADPADHVVRLIFGVAFVLQLAWLSGIAWSVLWMLDIA